MKKTLVVVILSVLVAAGCAARGVRVAELKDQPSQVRHQVGERHRRRHQQLGHSAGAVPAL